jgi:hypothetical protein
MTRGRMALVDGTLWPCWSWEAAPEMWAGKYKTTGHGSLIIGDECGNIIFQGYSKPLDITEVPVSGIFRKACDAP